MQLLTVEVKNRHIPAATSKHVLVTYVVVERRFARSYITFLFFPFNCSVLREQWIRAKYERTEFTGETKYPPLSYTTGDVYTVV